MNDYLAAAIIGVVEGLTEFLPVSSTAHIRICQELLRQDLTNEYWKMFAIVIQLGAILSVLVYFRQRIAEFLKTARALHGDWLKLVTHPVGLVLISFVVTAIPCYLIDELIGSNLESLSMMAWALILGGVVMATVDYFFSPRVGTKRLEDMTLTQGIVIGLAQILAAAFPGTSRSMATIAGGQIMGLSRSVALEFSFFLSLPVMMAATGFKLLSFFAKHESTLTFEAWMTLTIGFVVSFLVAWIVIAWFMRWVRLRGFFLFAAYRLIAGTAVLWWLA